MLATRPLLFDHRRHKLFIRDLAAPVDTLSFEGEETLSEPFTYRITFTSTDRDIPAAQVLLKEARFSLHPAPASLPFAGLGAAPAAPLRTLYGIITEFRRLPVDSRDEAHYEVTLQPRLALLGLARQHRIFQRQSVPEIVESILREHGMAGQYFNFQTLKREYPQREQVMQFGESDLAFITRQLADVGIWFTFRSDERLKLEMIEFNDDQRGYRFDVELPYRRLSGTNSSQDSAWNLRSQHRVVERHVNIRAYHHADANALLDGEVDQTRGEKGLYGEAYHYAEPYRTLGDPLALDEDLQSESGYFYARLRHERYLNGRIQLSGSTSSATLVPGDVLNVGEGAPEAFAPGAVITRLHTRAARDSSFEARFDAIPYAERICFRPPLPSKPRLFGTLPARIVSPEEHPTYAEIDRDGKYRVEFLFDRTPWKRGHSSAWLRLARPYAGDTYGLHLPLLAGTEVGVAFEQGDIDRPYIAYCFHDSRHPDLVTLQNYRENRLRTPANNELVLGDQRGQERIELSTEHSGKSQLNLGHLVDTQKQKRGEGFELRTDGHGAVRAGKGLFISADAQPSAQGDTLSMDAAIRELQEALELVRSMARDAAHAVAHEPDQYAPEQLKAALELLKQPGILASAPAGIALTSGQHLQLAAGQNLIATARANMDVSVAKRFTAAVGQSIGLFARKLGMKLYANQGPVTIQAQNDGLELLARHGLDIVSTEDEIHITAKKKITLNAGGTYITLDPYRIELGTRGDFAIKAAHFEFRGPAKLHPDVPWLPRELNDEAKPKTGYPLSM
ncbi:type VI secretion system Vgr family protein [Pseudomonas sp. 30_B]|uniref:type VI secretion system Vgr family protein n=1 Tax=Pseudomonas sp. 30_B TaxID=2813575 RepID=UPI001A9D3BDA|nr:type VI secretion system Vgr family protein [Pseudomonas sp. 30_B]